MSISVGESAIVLGWLTIGQKYRSSERYVAPAECTALLSRVRDPAGCGGQSLDVASPRPVRHDGRRAPPAARASAGSPDGARSRVYPWSGSTRSREAPGARQAG